MKTPYPDLALIKKLRGKFLEYTVDSLTKDELIDLINHQNERILDLERAALQPANAVDAKELADLKYLINVYEHEQCGCCDHLYRTTD